MAEGLHFDITGDNKHLISSLRQAQQAMEATINQIETGGKQVDKEMQAMGGSVESAFKRIAQAAGGIFAAAQAKQLLGQIMDVRKEFQSIELSFSTLLGDAQKGKKLFADITQFATSTPMLEKDLAKGAQTLLGFNIEAEKVMPILKQIGDISMGDSQKFESLTLAFAQASSTGKLMGQDLLQMINAGFNPLVEISRTTGKSISELKDDMSAGKISVEMLQNAFKTATDEGGKFHGMLNNMAGGLQGAFSNLEGAVQKLFNDLGQEMEGAFVDGANQATVAINTLAENLDRVGVVMGGVAATYGTYKAMCLAVTAAQAAQTVGIGALTTAEKAHYAWLALTQKAQALLNSTMLANPYVAAATAIAAVAAGMVYFGTRATGAEQAQKGLNDAISEQKKAEEEKNAAMQQAISLATDESKANGERSKGIQTLVAEYGPIIQKYIDEEGHLTNIIALKKELALLDGKKSVSTLQGQSKQYSEYARLAEMAGKGRASMSKADNAALDKAMEQYDAKTGGGKYAYGSARQYFASMAKGTAKQAGTAATQANVNSFSEGIGGMSTKQLQEWKKRLEQAQTLSASGSLVNIQGITKGATSDQINAMLTQIGGTISARSKKTDDGKKSTTKGGSGKSVNDELQKQAAERERLQEELTALEQKNQDEENAALEEGLDKKLAILKTAHENEIKELQKQATDWASQNKQAKMGGTTATATIGGVQTSGLTAKQAAALMSAQTLSGNAYNKSVKEAGESRYQSQIDYLKGSKNIYEQHQGNIMELQNQRARLDQGDTYALAANQQATDEENARFADELVKLQTGFEQIWQNFDTLSTQALTDLESKLRDAVQNGVNGQKVSSELASELQGKISQIQTQKQSKEWQQTTTGKLFGENGVFGSKGIGGNSFIGQFGQQQANIQQAKAQYETAKKDNETAKKGVEDAKAQYGENSQQYADAKKKQNETQAKEDQSGGMMSSLMSGAATGGVGLMVNGINANVQSMAEAGNLIFGEDSDAAKGISKFAESSQYATDAFNSLSQGDFIGAAMDVGNAISSLGELFGFWSNSNFDEWKDTNEELLNSQNDLNATMEALNETMENQTASESGKTLEAQKEILQQQVDNKISQFNNNAGLYNGDHSVRSKFNDNDDARRNVTKMYQRLAELTGDKKYLSYDNDFQSVFNQLSAEDLYKLQTDVAGGGSALLSQFWKDTRNAESDGNYGSQGSFVSDLQDYISSFHDAEHQLELSWYETVTSLSFDSFRDNFVSMMMDLNSELDDFTDDFTKSLTQSLMSDVVKEQYNDELDKLYTDWADLLNKRSSMTEAEYQKAVTELQATGADISQRMIATRDEVAATTGYSENESQKATQSSITNITQDQADQLIGRITAIQIAVEAQNANTSTQAQNVLNSYNVLVSMNNTMSLANATLNDMLLQQVHSNSYLADIVKTQRNIYDELEGRIERMANKIDTL
jgi:tape measure domain-containing protein